LRLVSQCLLVEEASGNVLVLLPALRATSGWAVIYRCVLLYRWIAFVSGTRQGSVAAQPFVRSAWSTLCSWPA